MRLPSYVEARKRSFPPTVSWSSAREDAQLYTVRSRRRA